MSVENIFGNVGVADGLRNIADEIDNGSHPDESCTIVIGTDVYHCDRGPDTQAGADAVFNLTLGIHKLMKAIFDDE